MRLRARRLGRYVRAFGPLRGPMVLAKLGLARRGLVQIDAPALGGPVFVRARTSDKPTFEQVFVFDDYDTSFLKVKPEIIIDGGANAGFATRLFARRYPEARIFAVEPEGSNFELLLRNTQHLSTVVPIRAALWNRPASLGITNPQDEKWAFQVAERQGEKSAPVSAVTIPEIMKRAGADHVDILKLDIEGAERELFSSGYDSWLGRVNVIIIELHDRLRPGCSASFYNAIGRFPFTQFKRGEHVILVRQSG